MCAGQPRELRRSGIINKLCLCPIILVAFFFEKYIQLVLTHQAVTSTTTMQGRATRGTNLVASRTRRKQQEWKAADEGWPEELLRTQAIGGGVICTGEEALYGGFHNMGCQEGKPSLLC